MQAEVYWVPDVFHSKSDRLEHHLGLASIFNFFPELLVPTTFRANALPIQRIHGQTLREKITHVTSWEQYQTWCFRHLQQVMSLLHWGVLLQDRHALNIMVDIHDNLWQIDLDSLAIAYLAGTDLYPGKFSTLKSSIQKEAYDTIFTDLYLLLLEPTSSLHDPWNTYELKPSERIKAQKFFQGIELIEKNKHRQERVIKLTQHFVAAFRQRRSQV